MGWVVSKGRWLKRLLIFFSGSKNSLVEGDRKEPLESKKEFMVNKQEGKEL